MLIPYNVRNDTKTIATLTVGLTADLTLSVRTRVKEYLLRAGCRVTEEALV